MARLIEDQHCPHCRAELPEPKPRVCPSCGGSIQLRYMKAGCLTSAPKLLIFALLAWWFARAL